MYVPTEEDWRSEDWEGDLDAEWAYREFRGMSMEEAIRLFQDRAISCSESLMYMPSRVFGFYLRAYIAYLNSDAAIDDDEAKSCFLMRIQIRAESRRDDIVPLWPEIEPMLRRIAEQMGNSAEEWTPQGSFLARVHKIIQLGFVASFDTAKPDVIPKSATLSRMGFLGGTVTFAVAVQIFRNSGIDEIEPNATRPDILRFFGSPDATGGGEHPKYGLIPDWSLYKRAECVIRFGFEGDQVSDVTFMSHADWAKIQSIRDAATNPELFALRKAKAAAAWEALLVPPTQDGNEDS